MREARNKVIRASRAAAAIGVVAMAAGCNREESPDAPTTAPTPAPITAPATLTRAEMVSALALAASAYAAGAAPSDGPVLAGRTFSIRLPFGCFGPADASSPQSLAMSGDGLPSWRWGTDRQTQQLSLAPVDWTQSPLVATQGETQDWERVDGFWIARPWLAADTCPSPAPAPLVPGTSPVPTPSDDEAPAAPPAQPTVAPFTAGIAAIRPAGGSRLGRRDGQPYAFTVRGEGDSPPVAPSDGYRVVLEGRVSTFPDGHAVRCTGDNPNRRPVCIAAVLLDSAAFETASGQRVSQWRPEG